MLIPHAKWLTAIKMRRSRRQFDGRTIEAGILEKLNAFTEELNQFTPGARAVIVTESPDKVFKGIIGSYGKIKNPAAYVAFIGDISDPNVQEKTGYLGECFILEATSLGLSTCWVGGFFNPKLVISQISMTKDEKVLCISPLGYAKEDYGMEEKTLSGFVASHKRKELASLCKGFLDNSFPGWIRSALEAARLAPSAINRQPWRFTIETDAILVSVDRLGFELGVAKRLDCGIAMLHLEVGALSHGVKGTWDFLDSPHVARFRKSVGSS